MNWLHYLLEANIYLGVFYLAYCLFLNKETHYLLNRVYLISSCIVSFILPMLQLGVLKGPLLPPPPMAPASFTAMASYAIAAPAVPAEPVFTWDDALYYAYWIGAVIVLILLVIKLVSLYKLIYAKQVEQRNNYKLVYITEANTAFSFFNYLFIGSNAPNSHIIIRHELVHIRQNHSVDIMFLEILKIINWFNPCIYLLQKSLKTVHEYIADEQSINEDADAVSYSSFLLNNAYGLSGPSITHSFFTYNLLKKRIIMLNQQRSGNLARLKYLVAVPIGAGLLCASTLGFSKTYGWVDLAPQKQVKSAKILREAPPVAIKNVKNDVFGDFFGHLRNTIHFPASLKNKPFGITLVASFELDNKGYIKNASTNNKSHTDVSNDVINAIKSYNKPLSDEFGRKHFMVLNFGKKNGPPPPPLDPAFEGKPGYLGTYLITDEPAAKLEIIKYPPPVVVPDNQVPGSKASNKKVPPPPQPPKPKVDQVKFPPPIVMDRFKPEKTYVNAKGYTIEEGHYTPIDNGATYYVVLIKDKNERTIRAEYKSRSGQREKYIYEKYGYKFPDVKVSLMPLPPEPPRPRVDKIKFPPPVVKPGKATPPKPKIDIVRFPPPIVKPDKNVFAGDFFAFMQKTIRYPADARENNITGNVIVDFNIDGNGNIVTPRVVKGIGHGCDEEALRALSAYKNAVNAKFGTYVMAITFALNYDDNTPPPPAEPIGNKIKNATNFAGQIWIVGYGKK